MVTKTNPAYAHLAHRRSIIQQMVSYLREEYMPLSSEEPKKVVICSEVFHEDAEVPPEEIQYVVEELEQEAEHLRLELGKFTFKKQEDSNGLLNSAKKQTETKKWGGRRR